MAILNFLEFFVTPDGFVYYKKPGEESKRLTKFNTDIVDELHKSSRRGSQRDTQHLLSYIAVIPSKWLNVLYAATLASTTY